MKWSRMVKQYPESTSDENNSSDPLFKYEFPIASEKNLETLEHDLKQNPVLRKQLVSC